MTDKVRLSPFDSNGAKEVVVYCVHRVPDELYSKTGQDRVDSIPRWTPYTTPPLALLESVPIPPLASFWAFSQPGSRALANLNLNLGLLTTWPLGGHYKP